MNFKISLEEAKKPIYWLHLIILAVIVLGILQIATHGNMFTLRNIIYSVPILAIGDLFAHGLLGYK